MKNYVDGGEAMLQALRALQVDYVFSSPGSDWGSLWEAFARQTVSKTPGPQYVSCGHETLAVNLALGHTFHTGRMQAVVLHAGVGLLQGAIGIDAANRLNLPMIIFSSEANSFGEKPGFDPGHQWIASLNVVGGPQRQIDPLVKWSSPATNSDTLFEMIVRAGELAQQNPAGPVYINIPIETLLAEWSPPKQPRKLARPATPQAPASEIANVARLLLKAECPVIVAESAGRQAEGYRALIELAELLAIPVIEPWPAEVANFPKDHPLHGGFTLQPFMDQADLVLLVRSRVPWYPAKNRPSRATVVTIDEMPVRGNMVYQNIQPDIVLEGDAIHTLKMLIAAVHASKLDAAKVKARREKVTAAHDKFTGEYRKAETETQGEKGLNPAWVLRTLSEALPKNAIFVDETITYRPFTLRHLQWHGPQSCFRVGGGLGQGFGTALGLKYAAPDRTVALVLGDGAFLYNPGAQCLAFSKHADKPVLVLILNNSGYRSMDKEHRAFYPEGTAAGSDIFYGGMITEFDYAELAKPFGAFGRKVTKAEDLLPAVKDALAALKDGKTAILNVVTD
jgi:acetolactate synthase-1/2/3 large subunit